MMEGSQAQRGEGRLGTDPGNRRTETSPRNPEKQRRIGGAGNSRVDGRTRLRPVPRRPGPRWTPSAAALAPRPPGGGGQSSFYRNPALPEHNFRPRAGAGPRKSGDGAPHQEPGAMERHG